MRVQPPSDAPDWDKNQTNYLAPDSGHLNNGWAGNEIPPSNIWNGFGNIVGRWLRWLQGNNNDVTTLGAADTDPILTRKLGLNAQIWKGLPTQTGYAFVEFDGTLLWLFKATGAFIAVNPGTGATVYTGTLGSVTVTAIFYDGQSIWAAVGGGAHTLKRVSLIGNVIATLTGVTNDPTNLSFDGTYLWASNGSQVTKVSTVLGSETIIGSVTTATTAGSLAWDGAYLWVALSGNAGNIDKIDPVGMTVLLTVSLQTYESGSNVTNHGIYYANGLVYVANVVAGGTGGLVTPIDTQLNAVSAIGPISIGSTIVPSDLIFDGRRIWVICNGNDSFYNFNITTFTLVSYPYDANGAPSHGCFDGTRIWIGDSSTGALLRLYS